MRTEFRSKITDDAHRRMVAKSARLQRLEALERTERLKSRPDPIPTPDDVEDADDASIRSRMLT